MTAASRRTMLAVVGGFAAVFGVLILRKHAHFGTQAFDLGIFDQGLWLLSRGETPFVTLRGLHLFADHSSYILFPLVPVYWLWPDVRALLIVTVLALAAAALILHKLARREGVSPWVATALVVAFLAHPANAWQVWDVFHPEVLAIPLLLGVYWRAVAGHPGQATLLALLTLTVKEDAALIVVPLAIYLGIRLRSVQASVPMAAAGVGAFLLNFWVLLPHFSPTGALVYTRRYSYLGDSLPSIAVGMLRSPLEVWHNLTTPEDLLYIGAMIFSAVVALAAPELLLLGVPITLANLLSTHTYQGEIQYHYTAYLTAVVAMASVVGARRIESRWPGLGGWLPAAIIVSALAWSAAVGPWPTAGIGDKWTGPLTDRSETTTALALIPDDASVSADYLIAPHLSHRHLIFNFGEPFRRENWSVPGEPGPTSTDVDYVIVRRALGDPGTRDFEAFQIIRASGRYELVFEGPSLLVFANRDRDT